jgi:hypothetical protein
VNVRLQGSADGQREKLRKLLRAEVQRLLAQPGKRTHLIAWTIDASGPLADALRREGLAEELASELRKEFGFASPAAWTTSLACPPPAEFPRKLLEEDTILGDFLRAVQVHLTGEAEPLRVEDCLEQPLDDPALDVAIGDRAERQRVLREAAALGLDLLQGGRP